MGGTNILLCVSFPIYKNAVGKSNLTEDGVRSVKEVAPGDKRQNVDWTDSDVVCGKRRRGKMSHFQVSPPEKFTFRSEDWPRWIKRFERFRIASGLEGQAEENQVNALIYTMGDAAEDIIVSFHLSSEEANDYDTVKTRLDAHFVTRRNIIFERAKFNQRQQETGETVDNFQTALQCLAEFCGYGVLHDEMVRDRFVVGLKDKRLSEQLQMDPDLTLEKAINRARQCELIRKQQEMLNNNFKTDISNVQLDKVYARPHGGAQKKQVEHGFKQKMKKPQQERYHCTRCGDPNRHHLSQCPAREAVCHQCRKKGHFARMCRAKRLFEVNVATVSEHPDEDFAFLGSLAGKETSRQWMTVIEIDNKKTFVKIDTGADVTANSRQIICSRVVQQSTKTNEGSLWSRRAALKS